MFGDLAAGFTKGAMVLLIFDGDCSFCTRSVEHLRTGTQLEWVPWQRVELEQYGISEAEALRSVWLIDGGRVVASGATAFSTLLERSPRRSWRAAGKLMALPGVRAVAAAAYRVVARYRHKLPGGTAACALPVQRG